MHPGQVFSKERTGKGNNKPKKVRKYVDPCDVYGTPVQLPKRPNPPPNGYIITLLKFICSNVFTYYGCGVKFYHQIYPEALGDLIVDLKRKRVFVNPATAERAQLNKFSDAYFHFKFACIFAHDRFFAPQLIQTEQDVKMCLKKVYVFTLSSVCITLRGFNWH